EILISIPSYVRCVSPMTRMLITCFFDEIWLSMCYVDYVVGGTSTHMVGLRSMIGSLGFLRSGTTRISSFSDGYSDGLATEFILASEFATGSGTSVLKYRRFCVTSKKRILEDPNNSFLQVVRFILTFVSTSWRHPWDPIPRITLRRASAMANTTPLVTTVTKPATNPGDTDTIPRVNIQEFYEEYYDDILPIIMKKVRHDRRKDFHTRLDFREGPRERTREDSHHSSARARATKPERGKYKTVCDRLIKFTPQLPKIKEKNKKKKNLREEIIISLSLNVMPPCDLVSRPHAQDLGKLTNNLPQHFL
nr:hypothetical protein [Tanacetum cinerariifolium]